MPGIALTNKHITAYETPVPKEFALYQGRQTINTIRKYVANGD
jgi:hypothetical protein